MDDVLERQPVKIPNEAIFLYYIVHTNNFSRLRTRLTFHIFLSSRRLNFPRNTRPCDVEVRLSSSSLSTTFVLW